MKTTKKIIGITAALVSASIASAISLDLNSLQHGEIVTNQFDGIGINISVVNRGGGPDIAAIFDSRERQTRDSDLEAPWSGGNVAKSTFVGNMLIVSENSAATNGILNNPDDEGSRPAGSIFFDFDREITYFGFDLIDVEGPSEYGRDRGYFANFYSSTGSLISSIGFGSLIGRDGAEFGDNYINRISPILTPGAHQVEINFGGSAAIGNINYSVPDSGSTLALLGFAFIGLALRKRLARR